MEGTREWSQSSYNIQIGCEHGCIYCYARRMNQRFPKVRIPDWTQPVIRAAAVQKAWTKHDGIIMFPTTHDITPANFSDILFNSREPASTWKGVITHGGPALGFSVSMPPFGETPVFGELHEESPATGGGPSRSGKLLASAARQQRLNGQ